jgi:hypothetical protein
MAPASSFIQLACSVEKPHDQPNAPAASAADPASAQVPSPEAPAPSAEGLPEWEPLTPELVEDEAVRGDFMLRWAAVLLAILLGCTEISNSLTLVGIRTGEYLAAHGVLPPRADVFSYTAGERAWINLGWLSDLLLAAANSVGGDTALSLLSAVFAGVTFWLVVNAGRTGVSTWWSSICAVLAALASFPLLRPGSDGLTLLGLAATMYVLVKSEDRPESRAIWCVVPLLWLWSNCDPHAFLGLALVLAYAIGRSIGGEEEGAAAPTRTLWLATGGAALAMFVNPFHWHAFESAWTSYRIVYPELRAYAGADSEFGWMWRPLTDREVWTQLDMFNVAGLLAALAALLAMVLNRNRLRWAHVLVWLAINGLAVAAARQLSAAAIVNAVLAAVNAQDWYKAGFRQTYSVEWGELLFSRGGRAITVLALFVLAYLGISGRLMGADGRRIGLGFNYELASSIDSYRHVLSDSFDNRPFNFLPEQGDVLIWVGQKPFIDNRIALYAHGGPNLARLHRELRLALRPPSESDPLTGDAELWQSTFDEFDVTHVVPRLSGRNPDYHTFFGLMMDPQRRWALARLGAATAALYHAGTQDAELSEYLAKHAGADFIGLAFPRQPSDGKQPLTTVVPLPRELTWYDRFLMLPRDEIPADVQLARHYNAIRVRLSGQINLDYQLALAVLTIRHARQGLTIDPNSADAWHALAGAYYGLIQSEQVLQTQLNSAAPSELRLRQLVSALHHALTCNPDDASAHLSLYDIQLQMQPDLALQHLLEFQRLTGGLTTYAPGTPEADAQASELRENLTQLTTQIDAAREELNAALASGTDRLQVVQDALRRGLPREALRILEEDQTLVAQNIPAQLLHAQLLLDAGRIEDGLTVLERLSDVMRQPSAAGGASTWREATAMANIAAGNDDRARELWRENGQSATLLRMQSILGLSPLPGEMPGLSSVPLTHGVREIVDARPLTRAALAGDLLLQYTSEWVLNHLYRALVLLETGDNDLAEGLLRQILDEDPETPYRPLVAFYLSTISGEAVEFGPPSNEIPVWDGMFAPDEPDSPSASPDVPAETGIQPAGTPDSRPAVTP